MRRLILLACAVVALAPALASSQPPPPPGPKPGAVAKWEYKVLSESEIKDLGKKSLESGLSELGKEGWELAALEPGIWPNNTSAKYAPTRFYFKRPTSKMPPLPPLANTKAEIKVYVLKSQKSVALAKILHELFKDNERGKLHLVADPASNSVIVDASPELLDAVEALIIRLDIAAVDKAAEKKPAPPAGQ